MPKRPQKYKPPDKSKQKNRSMSFYREGTKGNKKGEERVLSEENTQEVRVMWIGAKYDETMPAKIVEMRKQGATMPMFCAEVGISERTFYSWTAKYPEFKDASEIAETAAKGYYDREAKKALYAEFFNNQTFKDLMVRQFGHQGKRKLKVKQIDIDDLEKTLVSALQDAEQGLIDADELTKLTRSVNTIAEFKNNTKIADRLEELESFVKERMDEQGSEPAEADKGASGADKAAPELQG